MAGDARNASLWAEADVYVANSLTATIPTDASQEFGSEWGLVGLLDGSDGFTTTRDQDSDDKYAWGGILVRTSRGNFKLTKKFSALEDNAVTRRLIWPGSPAGKLVVPRPEDLLIAFETREGKRVHRVITSDHAQVDLDGDLTENQDDLTKAELVATIFPTADGELFIEQATDANGVPIVPESETPAPVTGQ